MKNNSEVETQKLSKRQLYTFGVGDFGFNAMISMETMFFAAFLTDYAKFPLALAGIIMTITSCADTISALVAGVILQKSNLKHGGKYRSWLLLGPPIVALFYILQFTKIGSDNVAATIICIGFIVSHLVCAILYTAYISLVGKISPYQNERTILSINKAQWNSCSNIVFSYVGMTLITFIATRTTPVLGYTYATVFWATLMVLAYWYVYSLTKGRDSYDNEKDNNPKSISTMDMIKLSLKNRPLCGLVLSEILRNSATFLVIGFGFYYFKYVINNLEFLPIYFLVSSLMQFLGTLVAPRIALKLDKRKSYLLGISGYAFFLILAKFLGTTAWSFTFIIGLAQFISRFAYSVNTALYSDTVVYGEYKTGVNTRGFIMSLLSLPIKVSMIVKSFVLSAGLVAIGYVADGPAVESVVNGISNYMTLLPGGVAILCLLSFYMFYRLDSDEVTEMEKAINER